MGCRLCGGRRCEACRCECVCNELLSIFSSRYHETPRAYTTELSFIPNFRTNHDQPIAQCPTTTSQNVPESWVTIRTIPSELLALPVGLAAILVRAVRNVRGNKDPSTAEEAENNGVAFNIVRALPGGVDLSVRDVLGARHRQSGGILRTKVATNPPQFAIESWRPAAVARL